MRKIVRVITRLNIGGPAQQAAELPSRMRPLGWETCLVIGRPEPAEGDMSYLLERTGVRAERIDSLRRCLSLTGDLRAGWTLFRILRRERPGILHTHTAKAGTLGRAAVLLHRLCGGRVKTVHTFHGHVLEGYFHPAVSALFLTIERLLAWGTDLLIAVSPAVREDLLRRRVAPPGKIRVVPLGLPLDPLFDLPEPDLARRPLRISMVGRLVPIKNHSLLLRAIQTGTTYPDRVRGAAQDFQFTIFGDGELRAALESETERLGLTEMVRFAGWETDTRKIYEQTDAVCLTSRNEGTPVCLIEAMAAGRPAVATAVGGVGDLLGPVVRQADGFALCERGLRVRPDDPAALSRALRFITDRPGETRAMARAGRAYARKAFGIDRLARDLDRLYRELLGSGSS